MNDQFKGDWATYIARQHPVEKSGPQIRALGVTDYFCIEAYKAVRRRYESGALPDVALLFPNVEFRLDIKTFMRRNDATGRPPGTSRWSTRPPQ